MSSVSDNQVSFLNTVINTYDLHPLPQNRSERGIIAHHFMASCAHNNRVSEGIYSFPGVLQTQIYNMQPTQSLWILTTGILDPTRVKDEETQKAIDESLKQRLTDLGQRVLAPPSSRGLSPEELKAATRKQLRNQFFSHLFETAYDNASVEEKQAIIKEMRPLLSQIRSTYSKFQRGWIELQEKFSEVMGSNLATIALGFACACLLAAILASLKVLFVKLMVAYLVPHIVNPFINHAPLIAIKACSILIDIAGYALKHQISLFFFSILAHAMTQNYPRLNRLQEVIFNILLLPLRIIFHPAFLLILLGPATLIFGSSVWVKQKIADSVANKCARDRVEHFTREGANAYDVWMQTIEGKL